MSCGKRGAENEIFQTDYRSAFILHLYGISGRGESDCQMSTAYEDQMHKIADFDKGAFKGRFALMNGQCSGHTSYMATSLIIMEGSKRLFLIMKEYRK